MKYIRTQNGEVYSISQLMPPSKAIAYTEESKEIWRLSLITVDGKRETYMIYDDREVAFAEYAKVICFLASEKFLYVFEPGSK